MEEEEAQLSPTTDKGYSSLNRPAAIQNSLSENSHQNSSFLSNTPDKSSSSFSSSSFKRNKSQSNNDEDVDFSPIPFKNSKIEGNNSFISLLPQSQSATLTTTSPFNYSSDISTDSSFQNLIGFMHTKYQEQIVTTLQGTSKFSDITEHWKTAYDDFMVKHKSIEYKNLKLEKENHELKIALSKLQEQHRKQTSLLNNIPNTSNSNEADLLRPISPSKINKNLTSFLGEILESNTFYSDEDKTDNNSFSLKFLENSVDKPSKRTSKKRQCPICGKTVVKLPRHLRTHKDHDISPYMSRSNEY